jgi:hypothetical protein
VLDAFRIPRYTPSNQSAAPLNSIQLDLPGDTAVTYSSGPGIPPEGIESGTLNLGDLGISQTLPFSLTVLVNGAPESGLIELPFHLRSAATDPITVTVTLLVEAIPGVPEQTEIKPEETPQILDGEPTVWQMGYTPPGSSAFTGAATYSYPIAVPPGIGGLTPSLVLSYNSRGIEDQESLLLSQGFGSGWAMPQAEIINGNAMRWADEWPGFQFCDGFDNDRFTLLLNGITYHLKARTGVYRHGPYDALGDPGISIEYKGNSTANVTGEYWLVRTADGTEYTFGKSEHAEQVISPLKHWLQVKGMRQ